MADGSLEGIMSLYHQQPCKGSQRGRACINNVAIVTLSVCHCVSVLSHPRSGTHLKCNVSIARTAHLY